MTEKVFTNVHEVLEYLQRNIAAPKTQHNKHGDYNYRSCEDILEAAKKVMPEGAFLRLEDDIISLPVDEKLDYTKVTPTTNGADTTTDNRFTSGRVYVKSTAILSFAGGEVRNVSFAREAASQKGFNASQITVAASSFARKTALSGMLMIDDDKDTEKKKKSKEDDFSGDVARDEKEEAENKVKKVFGGPIASGLEYDEDQVTRMYNDALKDIASCADLEKLKTLWKKIGKGKSVFTEAQWSDLEQAKDEAKTTMAPF